MKPTASDFINAQLVTDRILLRKLFEELRDRPQSKYFKNITIKNVHWHEKTFRHSQFPLNFPQEFLEKYPFDFEASFTTLGCNMLKCYKHKKDHDKPTLINNSIYACSEACVAIYKEFNDYLREKFNILIKEKKKEEEDFPVETFSIYDKVKNENFCGIQLTSFKTFSILPSSRWFTDKDISVEEYVKDNSTNLRNLAGLVDAPPLTWNTEKQNAHFNRAYCKRFQKEYLAEKDECFLKFHREALSFLFGYNFVNMFPEFEDVIINGSIPFEHLKDYITGNGLNINDGYFEEPVSQLQLEEKMYVDTPDRITENCRVINNKSSSSFQQRKVAAAAAAINNIFVQIIEEAAKEAGIEMSVTTLPSISARLLKHYSSKFLERALAKNSFLPLSIRLFSLTARMVINELTIKLAAKLLTFIASTANIFFTVTIITIIPDLILSYYNIGGFDNELTREQIEKRRKSTLDNILKVNMKQYDDALNFIVVDDDYISPIITPEFVYKLCLYNFLKHNPDKAIDICHNGLGPEEDREDLSLEYLKLLKVNSVGQIIKYKKEEEEQEEDDKEFINYTLAAAAKETNKVGNLILKYDADLYFLSIGSVLLILSIILYLFNPILSCIFIYSSLFCFIIWVIIFKPCF